MAKEIENTPKIDPLNREAKRSPKRLEAILVPGVNCSDIDEDHLRSETGYEVISKGVKVLISHIVILFLW